LGLAIVEANELRLHFSDNPPWMTLESIHFSEDKLDEATFLSVGGWLLFMWGLHVTVLGFANHVQFPSIVEKALWNTGLGFTVVVTFFVWISYSIRDEEGSSPSFRLNSIPRSWFLNIGFCLTTIAKAIFTIEGFTSFRRLPTRIYI
jgi:hypothetical protein